MLRFKRYEGGWDVRTFRGTVEEARKEVQKNESRYESGWMFEAEDRKL